MTPMTAAEPTSCVPGGCARFPPSRDRIAILRLLGRSPEPMGVKAIAQSLAMVTSTCLHILRVLVDEELVKVDATKRYSLGLRHALARAQRDREQRLPGRRAAGAGPPLQDLGRHRRSASKSRDSTTWWCWRCRIRRFRFGCTSTSAAAFPRLSAQPGVWWPPSASTRGAKSSGAFARCAGRTRRRHRRLAQGCRAGAQEAATRWTAATTSVASACWRFRYSTNDSEVTHTLVAAGVAEQLDNARCRGHCQGHARRGRPAFGAAPFEGIAAMVDPALDGWKSRTLPGLLRLGRTAVDEEGRRRLGLRVAGGGDSTPIPPGSCTAGCSPRCWTTR